MAGELDPSPKVPNRDRKEAELDVPDENAPRVRRDLAAGLEPGDGSDTASDYSNSSRSRSDTASNYSNMTSDYSDTLNDYSDKENLRPVGADGLPAPRANELSHSSAWTVTTGAVAPDHGADEFSDEGASNNKMLDHLNRKFKKILKDRADKYYNGKSGGPEHSGGQEDEGRHEEPVSERTHAWLNDQEKVRTEAATEKAPDKSTSQISKAFEAIYAAIEGLQRAGMDADLCQAMKGMVEQVEKHWLDATGGRMAEPSSNSAADSTETSRSDLFKARERERVPIR